MHVFFVPPGAQCVLGAYKVLLRFSLLPGTLINIQVCTRFPFAYIKIVDFMAHLDIKCKHKSLIEAWLGWGA